jgi:DinB superfamily
MNETPQQYAERVLGYVEGKDPLKILATTPARLASLLKGKTNKQLKKRPGGDKWSIAEITAHLGDAEVAIAWRLRQILSTDGVAIQGYDQNAWAAAFDYARRDPKQSLQQFRALRDANVALLRSVPRKLWENYGMHSERGKESVGRVVGMVAGHDLNHLRQIEGILKAKRYV